MYRTSLLLPRKSLALAYAAWAFVKRDFQIEASYRVAFLLEAFASVVAVVPFYFVSKTFGRANDGALARYGGEYFSFVVVGMALMQYFTVSLRAFSAATRRAQMAGCLEATLSTRTPPEYTVLFSSLYVFAAKTVHVAVLLLTGYALVGRGKWSVNVLSAGCVLALTILNAMGIGILSAAAVLLLKKSDPVEWTVTAVSGLLSGALFPVAVLPVWMRSLAFFVPTTHGLEAFRMAVIRGHGLSAMRSEVLFLLFGAAVLLPAGLLAIRQAMHIARRTGTLGEY